MTGVTAVIILNVLLRSAIKVGGLFATLIIAALVAAAMAWCFARIEKRSPNRRQRWQLITAYGGILAILYFLLIGMASFKRDPSLIVLAIVLVHYVCYPFFVWLFFSPRQFSFFLPAGGN